MEEATDWVFTITIDYPAELLPLHRVSSLMVLGALSDRMALMAETPGQLVLCFKVYDVTRDCAETIGIALARQALRAAGLPGITTYQTHLITQAELQEQLNEDPLPNDHLDDIVDEMVRQAETNMKHRYN